MRSVLRLLLAFVVALCAAVPTFGEPGGGEQGWTNLPGGISAREESADVSFRASQSLQAPLKLRLDPTMNGAIAVVEVPDAGYVVLPTHHRGLVVEAATIAALVDAGVRELRLTFVALHDMPRVLKARVTFDPEADTTTITVP